MSEPNNIGWYIVKFIDEDTIEAVPSNWLKNFENCVWPLYTEKNKMAAAIKQKENPKDDWTSHKIFMMSKKRIMNFQQAMRLAHKATIDSELSTMEDDPQEIAMKIKSRISKPNPKYSISDSEEDIPQIKINKTKTRLKIPDFPQLSGQYFITFLIYLNYYYYFYYFYIYFYSNILNVESISPELLHLHNKTSKNIAEQKSHSIVKKRLSYEIDDDILPNANKKKNNY